MALRDIKTYNDRINVAIHQQIRANHHSSNKPALVRLILRLQILQDFLVDQHYNLSSQRYDTKVIAME